MSTILPSLYTINGIIDTSKSVLENMNQLAETASCWMSFDVHQGKWAVVINTTGSSVASFNNSNIIGGIAVTSTGLNEVYNSVEMEFPHTDLIGEPDFIKVSIASGSRYPNEPDNVLTIRNPLVNNPIQAQALASRLLKQSRIDKAIEFTVDYSYLGLKAGNLIDITNSDLAWSSKIFRIVSIGEADSDDGAIVVRISAVEYDANVYSTAGLTYELRERNSAIPTKNNNSNIRDKDDELTTAQLGRLLLTTITTGLLNAALQRNPITKKIEQILGPANAQRENDILTAFDNGNKAKALTNIKLPNVIITGPSTICEGSTLNLTLDLDCIACLFDPINFNYTITGVSAADMTSVPLTGTVTVPGTMSIPIVDDGVVEGESLTITIGSTSKTVTIYDRLNFTYVTNASPTSVTEGNNSTVTLTTTGVADGTSVPYTISGTGTSRVSTALTGNVTVNSNSATLTVATIDDGVYTGNQTVTVTFNPSQADNCNQLDKTAVITIVDNETAPPPDTNCQTVIIPYIWCPVYDGSDGQVKSLTAIRTMTVQAPVSGGPTISVPQTVSVTKGNPSTVTVLTTTQIDASSNKPGLDFNVITSFNSIAPNGVVTGTTTAVRGY